MELRSLDFEEFLWARGYAQRQIESLVEPLLDCVPYGDAVKETIDRLFLDYCVLGGMPAVVASYFSKGGFEGIPLIQQGIIRDYRADIRKYCEGLDPVRILSVFNSIPSQLAKKNKKFQWTTVERGAKAKDYWGCVEWLADAGVVNVCRRLDFPELPMAGHVQNDFYKLYLADSGLLVSLLDKESQEDVRFRRNLGTWKGGLYENIVGEALVKGGAELNYYKKDGSTLEIDFLVRCGDDLVPIEVKAGNNQAKSLKSLIGNERYGDIRWGIKFVHGNVGFANDVLTVPQWCAFLLPRYFGAKRNACRR